MSKNTIAAQPYGVDIPIAFTDAGTASASPAFEYPSATAVLLHIFPTKAFLMLINAVADITNTI